ncbi:methyltransferase domain-containing protein [Picosynechococcus sp. PCC 11901]|uniref:class I SAM-dependent methyltransferase n=1 Tax=Picosynechococcus sp. PCC 11901 TaxID=2579791 RepID=UPI0010FBDC0C|nr:methyltransferase domain-containing protein [Picosynechococcus sp. PCC 11901]QCS49147.1 methyltransferase domain-containing protein [Picosynechococcus sp. PCC 11901]
MADYQLLIDLHKDAERQGPGGNPETKLALDLLGIDKTAPLKIADIGCGTGASTLVLAEQLNAQITAVDFLPDFLEVLETRAKQKELSEKISTLCCSMENLPFNDAEFDVIWSEGAIYNIGFEKGIKDWHRYLKPGGLLVVSEITWLTNFRPLEIQKYWEVEYPEIDLASAKFALLEEHGYSPIGYFVLPERCWLENYYQPMQARFQDFLKRNNHSENAHSIVEMETREIELYEQYKAYYSYGVYIARKLN